MTQRIRFGEPIEFELPGEILPPERLIEKRETPTEFIRQQRSKPFQVYIVERVFREIWEQLENSPDVETGGVLVGHPFRVLGEENKTFIVIVGAIRQDTNNRSVGHFTVSPREIAAARTEIEVKYPGLVVVGWYHSHPGHGIFLSGQDMIIVRSIYNAEWHLALVVDPNQGKAGFFRGPTGERLSGWLELTEAPIIVEAIKKYNQIKEMLTQQQLAQAREQLIQLERIVESPDMTHWRSLGGYRDVTTLFNQPPKESATPLLPREITPSSAAEASENRANYSNKLNILERYTEAKQLFAAAFEDEDVDQGKLREALQIFKWIQLNSRDYEDTKTLVRVTEKVLSYLETKRSARPHRSSILKEILNIFDIREPRLLEWFQDLTRRNPDRDLTSPQKHSTNSPPKGYEQQRGQRPKTGMDREG